MFPSSLVTIFLAFGCFTQIQGQFTICLSNYIVNPSQVTFTLYKRTVPNGVVLNNANLNLVDPTLRTVFINHGWLQGGTQAWIIEMKDEYLAVEDLNVIVVNWAPYAFCLNYYPSANAARQVGTVIGNFIWNLVSGGFTQLDKVQINGFSLGAQGAGIAGQQVQIRSGGLKIGRINALDAAGPDFEGKPVSQRVDASDATFVQAWHTSYSGMFSAYGTIDVYFNYNGINCGTSQPGCPQNPGVPVPAVPILPIIFCDLIRSVVYFIETIKKPPNQLLAAACSCQSFSTIGGCTGSSVILVGEYCSSSATGIYSLNTNCKAPWALGISGTNGGIANYLCS